ncbi:MAG: PAS domain-containing sensor histidine kinase [Acidobacteriota bacterium]
MYRQETGPNSILRLVAFSSIAVAVGLHNRFVLHETGVETFVLTSGLFLLYCTLSWLILKVFVRRFPTLASALVLTDIVPLTFAVYISGGERSLLFFLPILRVADQTQTSFRRALFLGHAAIAAYAVMMVWIARSGTPMDWQREIAKFGILWAEVIYTAAVARVSDRRNRRLTDAVARTQKFAADLRDQSEHLQNSQSELQRIMRRNDLILESAGEGIVGVDLEGVIVFANSRAANVVGSTVQALIGRPGHDLAPHLGDEGGLCEGRGCPLVAALRSGTEQRGEHPGFLRPDGETVPVEFTSAPMHEDGELRGAVFSFRDVTAKKAAEKELIRARDAAEEANFGKSRFLANMSHELRTPLNAVIGYSEMIEEEMKAIDREDLSADAEKIRHSGERLLGMINDILEISRIQAGRMELNIDNFDVADFASDIAGRMKPLLAARGNQFHFDCQTNAGSMQSDPEKIRRALVKLLENANKFTEHGEVSLNVKREGGTMIFEVSDTGIGLTSQQAAHIFEPFRQGDISSTRKFGGTGLGLAIVNALVGLLGGNCTVTSAEGKGSTFQAVIPADAPLGQPRSEEGERGR